jgi:aminoglycoside phosphotransferase
MTAKLTEIHTGRESHAILRSNSRDASYTMRPGDTARGAVQRHIDDRRTELAREQLRLDWLQSDLDAAT